MILWNVNSVRVNDIQTLHTLSEKTFIGVSTQKPLLFSLCVFGSPESAGRQDSQQGLYHGLDLPIIVDTNIYS